jgi:NAD(P)-dependent dehydrogenase (short-subunit alcohol dehydrogenase family)
LNIAIVGSSRGIGLEFVRELSKQHDVYAFCRSANKELRALGTKAVIEGFEATDSSSMAAAFKKVSSVQFDWVLVVAGVLSDEDLSDWSDDGIMNQFAVNALGALNSARLLLPQIKADGKIGFLTSRMGSIQDNTSGGMYGYRMSKAALNAGAKSLALDLKQKNITVLLLHPGYVKTDMTGHSGQLEPHESVMGLINLMNTKGIESTGTFWHTNGEALPW